METVWFCDCEEDLMGVTREVLIGLPWKDDLWSKKEDLGLEESEEVKGVVAMALVHRTVCFNPQLVKENDNMHNNTIYSKRPKKYLSAIW